MQLEPHELNSVKMAAKLSWRRDNNLITTVWKNMYVSIIYSIPQVLRLEISNQPSYRLCHVYGASFYFFFYRFPFLFWSVSITLPTNLFNGNRDRRQFNQNLRHCRSFSPGSTLYRRLFFLANQFTKRSTSRQRFCRARGINGYRDCIEYN